MTPAAHEPRKDHAGAPGPTLPNRRDLLKAGAAARRGRLAAGRRRIPAGRRDAKTPEPCPTVARDAAPGLPGRV